MSIPFRIDRAKQSFTGILSAIIFSLFFSSCTEDPGFVGKNLLPEGDNIHTFSDTVSVIKAWTVSSLPIITSTNSQLLIGSRYDSLFGYTKADFMVPLFPVSPKDPGTNISVDSIILEIAIDRHFGDSLTSHTFRVYELTDTISLDSTYLSNFIPEGHYRPVEIASKTIIGYTDTIKFKISESVFIDKFINSSREALKHDSLFRDKYKGLYVTTDRVTEKGSLLFVDSLLNNSGMHFYYQNDSSRTNGISNLVYRMGFIYAAAKVNMFKNEYAGYRAGENINNPESSDTLLFIAAMGSMDVRLNPQLEHLKSKAGKIVINKAELIIPTERSLSVSRSLFPPRLLLWNYNEVEGFDFLYDYSIDATQNRMVFNGIYEYFKKDRYIFNISRHVQAYIDGEIDNMELILRSTFSSQSVYRTILKTSDAIDDPMKLVIVYTEL